MSSKLIWSSLSYAYIKSKQYERVYEFINEDVKKPVLLNVAVYSWFSVTMVPVSNIWVMVQRVHLPTLSAGICFVNVKSGDLGNSPAPSPQTVCVASGKSCLCSDTGRLILVSKMFWKWACLGVRHWWQWQNEIMKKKLHYFSQFIWSALQVKAGLRAICGATPLTYINWDQTWFMYLCGLTPLNSLVKLC